MVANESSNSPAVIDNVTHVARQRRPGDVMNKNTEHLPTHQRDALRWLHAYGAERDLSNRQLADAIDYSETTISRLFGDRMGYEGNLDEVAEAINRLKDKHDAQRQRDGHRTPFQETTLAKHIHRLGKLAMQYNRIVPAWGEAQIGKSRSAREFADRNLGKVIYCEMPVGGALTHFTANLSRALRIGSVGKAIHRRRVIEAFDGSMLLIVDQMHRAFMDTHGKLLETLSRARLDTLDYLIEIFDGAEPGMLLIGSNVWRDGVKNTELKNFFRQLRGRSLDPEGFQLPDLPSRTDLNLFAAHYGLPPASGDALTLQDKTIGTDGGLAVWLTRLKLAAKKASKGGPNKSGRKIAWDDVIKANDVFGKIARYEVRYDLPKPTNEEDES